MATPEGIATWPFHERLQWLFDNVPRPDGRKFGRSEVAEAVGITRQYIYRLLNPKPDDPPNPTGTVIAALAEVFGVPNTFLLNDARSQAVLDEMQMARRLKDLGITEASFRGVNLDALSAEQKAKLGAQVIALIDRAVAQGGSRSAPDSTPRFSSGGA